MVRHLRFWLVVLLCVSTTSAVNAQGEKKKAGRRRVFQKKPRIVKLPVVKMTLHPAAAPVPALKYQLLPRTIDQKPGNAALDYNRAIHILQDSFHGGRAGVILEEQRREWMKTPLDKLPIADVEAFLKPHESAFRDLERAANRAYCHWNVPFREEGVFLRLPMVQNLRGAVRLTVMKIRLEIARGNNDEALRLASVNYAISRNLCKRPALISCLVGLSIASQTTEQIVTLIQQPGAPNLYWAFTDLPRPFIDMTAAMKHERLFLEYNFPELARLKNGPVRLGEAQRMTEKILKMWMDIDSRHREKNVKARFVRWSLEMYPAAKEILRNYGYKPVDIEAMPVQQVVFLDSIHHYERLRDEMFKWVNLPYPQALAGMEQAEMRMKNFRQKRSGGRGFDFADFLPAVRQATNAALRRDRRFAELRLIEALRMYAATHGGTFPKSLKEITEVPLPVDPYDGLPYAYKLEGRTAVIEVQPPQGQQAYSHNSRRYELTLAK